MAVCDYCGTTYRGGAAVHGKLRFCTHQCRDRGKVLEVLDHVAPSIVDEEIERVRSQPCPECGGLTGVDIHKSHRIWSAMVYTTWKTESHFCCQSCGRKHQLKSLAFWIAWMVDADRLSHHAVSNNPERERHVATR
jgi:hypothetical protein